jgi:hypothetical protein
MSTERLLDLYAEAAKRSGLARQFLGVIDNALASNSPEKRGLSPERLQGAADVRELGEALRARGPAPEVERLFEDDSPDVRMCATLHFPDVAPELASAATSAIYAGLPTREVVVLKQRALQPPPRRPTFKEMSIDALVARFEDAATREYATRFLESVQDSQDMTERNRILDEIWGIMRELKTRDALDRLVALLASPNMTVRREAATACLRVAEHDSIAVLDEVAANGGFDDGIPAKEALDNWRKKGFVVYGV